MRTIIEFFKYLKMFKYYQRIELNESEKNKLESFDKDIVRKIVYSSIDNLSKELLNDNIDREYALGYKQALMHIMSYFKK